MARMYPSSIDPDTKSDAERKLYEAFRDNLDDDYTVFHSVAWQAQDREGRPRDGEVDFVVAHSQRGILVLETKGGAIRCDPRTGNWISIDRSGGAHPIKDPFAQARNSKYALEDALRMRRKTKLHTSRLRMNIGHAVAFPDVLISQGLTGLDKPREIILDSADLANLSGWVGGALAYWRGKKTQRHTAPGKRALQALVELLGKAWELRPALWGQFVQEQQQLISLTEQQYQVLDVLNRQRQALICGCAGSGKTMLAAEKATRLAGQGFHVLLTCFNKNLAADLRVRLPLSPNLDIVNFHELCYKLAEQAKVLPQEHKSDDVFFNQQLPEALMEATDILEVHYDAIVVDEGQDFQEHWWVPLQNLLRDPDGGIFYIFFDDNQRLYVQRSAFPVPQEPYSLTVNCRNTQNIHYVVVQFYDAEDRPTARGPAGRPVEVEYYNGSQGLRPTLKAILQRLTVDEQIPAEHIAMLSPLLEESQLWADADAGRSSFTITWPPSPGQIYFGSIYAFKGLERAVIVLVELEHWWEDLIPLLYTGCSRACNHLIVLLPQDVGPEVREAFAVVGGRT